MVQSNLTDLFSVFGHETQVWRAADHESTAANICLHRGGPLEQTDGVFVNSWHGAQIDVAMARRRDGPALSNARLMILPTRIEQQALAFVWGEPS